jgi:hypothetical protein
MIRVVTVVTVMTIASCSKLQLEPTADAPVDVTGVPCRAATVDGGIEYDCIFDGELGVCGGDVAAPTCMQRCPAVGACWFGRPHDVVVSSGAGVCYCE